MSIKALLTNRVFLPLLIIVALLSGSVGRVLLIPVFGDDIIIEDFDFCGMCDCDGNHVYGEWNKYYDTTCFASGGEGRDCTNKCGGHDCFVWQERYTPFSAEVKAEHEAQWEKVPYGAHCEDDIGGYIYCPLCDTYEHEVIDFPATGHNWGDWEVRTLPTVDDEGEEFRVCINFECEEEQTRIIDKLPPVTTTEETTPPEETTTTPTPTTTTPTPTTTTPTPTTTTPTPTTTTPTPTTTTPTPTTTTPIPTTTTPTPTTTTPTSTTTTPTPTTTTPTPTTTTPAPTTTTPTPITTTPTPTTTTPTPTTTTPTPTTTTPTFTTTTPTPTTTTPTPTTTTPTPTTTTPTPTTTTPTPTTTTPTPTTTTPPPTTTTP
ncbi:MAG: hypothetical protein FWF94_08485, partial [Oscillospiraceae bacterium]|nr:hypothetical protein [Oscillospiraceae bacterium]